MSGIIKPLASRAEEVEESDADSDADKTRKEE
jgi:hypothetical protein